MPRQLRFVHQLESDVVALTRYRARLELVVEDLQALNERAWDKDWARRNMYVAPRSSRMTSEGSRLCNNTDWFYLADNTLFEQTHFNQFTEYYYNVEDDQARLDVLRKLSHAQNNRLTPGAPLYGHAVPEALLLRDATQLLSEAVAAQAIVRAVWLRLLERNRFLYDVPTYGKALSGSLNRGARLLGIGPAGAERPQVDSWGTTWGDFSVRQLNDMGYGSGEENKLFSAYEPLLPVELDVWRRLGVAPPRDLHVNTTTTQTAPAGTFYGKSVSALQFPAPLFYHPQHHQAGQGSQSQEAGEGAHRFVRVNKDELASFVRSAHKFEGLDASMGDIRSFLRVKKALALV